MNLIGKLRKEKEFRQQCCRNSTKIGERERQKGGERKKRNFGNTVTEIPLPKMLPVQLKKSNCGNAIAKIGEKKILVIVAMALPRMGKKLNEIMAMSLPKMGEKKNLLPKSGKKF